MFTVSVPRSVAQFFVPVRAGCRSRALATLALSSLLAAAACDSPALKPTDPDGGGTPDGGAVIAVNAAPPSGTAVLSSDYSDTSIALYDPATGQLRDDCLHSGATGPNMPQALSGDVTLPSQPQHGGELVAIDRKNATITYVDAATCTPRLQFSVSTGGFKSNPHDVISLSPNKAYVTRYEKNANPTPTADDFDDGDDILVVDPTTGAIIKSIPLSLQVPAGTDPSVQARPDRGVLADGKVYVTLNAINADFSITGGARLLVIDPQTDYLVSTIDLGNQKGCSGLDYNQATKELHVACGGAFSDGRVAQVMQSALVEFDLSGGAAALRRVVLASQVGGQPINFSSTIVLGGFAFVGTLGQFPDTVTGTVGTSDAFFVVGWDGTPGTKLLEASASNLGRAATDVSRQKVLLPDGDFVTPRVHVFDAAGVLTTESGTFESNPAGHLPPREVAWY